MLSMLIILHLVNTAKVSYQKWRTVLKAFLDENDLFSYVHIHQLYPMDWMYEYYMWTHVCIPLYIYTFVLFKWILLYLTYFNAHYQWNQRNWSAGGQLHQGELSVCEWEGKCLYCCVMFVCLFVCFPVFIFCLYLLWWRPFRKWDGLSQGAVLLKF